MSAPRCPRAPQPDAILELALGEHHLDRIAFALEAGHNNVLERVDAPRRARDLTGQPPQAELGRRDIEHEIEQPFEGGGGDVDARSRRDEPVPAARARAGNSVVSPARPREHPATILSDSRVAMSPDAAVAAEPTASGPSNATALLKAPALFRRPAPKHLDGFQNAGAQVPELDHERSPLLLQQVAALGRQADLQAPSDQLGTGRAQLLHELSTIPVSLSCRPAEASASEDGAAHLRRLHTPGHHGVRSTQREPFDRFTGKRCPQLPTERDAFESWLRRMSRSALRHRSRTFCRRQPTLRRGLSMRAMPRLACSTAPGHTSSA